MSNISVGTARQLPGTRPEVSDRGFTGHRHNDGLGLIYMNARYYAPELRRFISADTIVPEPGNPMAFNRYAYAYQNPINLRSTQQATVLTLLILPPEKIIWQVMMPRVGRYIMIGLTRDMMELIQPGIMYELICG